MPKVAVAQMISTASVQKNLKQVEQFFIHAQKEQADLLALPENFAFMGLKETDKLRLAEKYGSGEIQDKISQLAKQYDLWVIAGTLPVQGLDGKVRSSCLVFDNNGRCTARYDKIHLFDVRVSAQELTKNH